MKTFKEFYIKNCPSEGFNALITDIETMLPSHWEHAVEVEEKAKDGAFMSDQEMGVFEIKAEKFGITAHLFLMRYDNGLLKVSNIVPTDVGQIPMDIYNKIVQDFYDAIQGITAKNSSLDIQIEADEKTETDYMSQECQDKFNSFVSFANKRALHPLDRERWRKFLIAIHQDKSSSLSSSALEQILWEDKQWPVDEAEELAKEYSCAMELLKDYDSEKE